MSTVTTSEQVLDTDENDIINFSTLPTDGRLLDNSFVCLTPVSATTPTSTEFHFKIHKNILPRYTMLSEIFVSCKLVIVKVTKSTGTVSCTSDDDNIAVIDMPGTALFKKAEV